MSEKFFVFIIVSQYLEVPSITPDQLQRPTRMGATIFRLPSTILFCSLRKTISLLNTTQYSVLILTY